MTFLRMVVVVFPFFLLSLTVPALSADMELVAPDKAYVGQVFLARVVAEEKPDSVAFVWRGRTLEPPVRSEGNGWTAEVLLGTDVKYQKQGVRAVTARIAAHGKKNVLERSITLYAKDFPEERLTVEARMVSPPKEVHERIQEEARAAGRALGVLSRDLFWTAPFVRPVPGAVSSVYGLRRFFNDQPRSPHRGLDFNAKSGEPVYAANRGRVVLAGDHYFAGNSVYIDHGLGVVSVYFHLSETGVREGDLVEKGARIGRVGATGRVTAPHLHFGIYILKHAVDPLPLFESDFFEPSARMEKKP